MDNGLNVRDIIEEDMQEGFFRPPGLEQPGMQELIRVVTEPTSQQHQQQEVLRILRDSPSLTDYFIKQRQKERGICLSDYGNPNVDRLWQLSVSAEERRLLEELIAHKIKAYPAPKPHQIWSGEPVLLEVTSFGTASSRLDYFRILAAEVHRVATQLEERYRH